MGDVEPPDQVEMRAEEAIVYSPFISNAPNVQHYYLLLLKTKTSFRAQSFSFEAGIWITTKEYTQYP